MPSTRERSFGMKWYKFLIYFALFASALLNFLYGVNYLTGGIYEVTTDGDITAEMVYSYYGGTLKAVDVVYGLIIIALAIFALIVRSKLAMFDYNAPKCLYILYVVAGSGQLLYVIATSIITKVAISMTEIIKVLIVFAILFANYKYFKKRAYLFCPDFPVEFADIPTTSFSPESAEQYSEGIKTTDFSLSSIDEKPTKREPNLIYGTDIALEKPMDKTVADDVETIGSKPPQVKFCWKCGSRLMEGARFCSHCGAEIQKG